MWGFIAALFSFIGSIGGFIGGLMKMNTYYPML